MQNQYKSERPTIDSVRNPADLGSGPGKRKNSNTVWLGAAAVLSVLILTLAFLNLQKYDVFGGESSTAEPTAETTDAADGSSLASPAIQPPATTAEGFPDSSALIATAQEAGGAWVVGLQQDFQFRISGSVPSEEVKTAISGSVVEAYGQNPNLVLDELTVDTSLTPAPWLNAIPSYLKVLPLELVEGSFVVNSEKTLVGGVAPGESFINTVREAAVNSNMPPFESTVTVGQGRPPTIAATATGDRLDMIGTVPSQRLVDIINEDAVKLWGEGNVTNNLAVDETTFARYPVILFGQRQLGTFFPLGDFTLKLEQGALSATVDGGVLFAPGSSTISAATQADLAGFPAFLNAVERPISVLGYTDDTGDPAENLILSQSRADAAKQFFVDSGVAADRITAEGRGEENPVASNETSEGRSQNRRVEITLGNT